MHENWEAWLISAIFFFHCIYIIFTTEAPEKPTPRILDERLRRKQDLAGSTTAQHPCGHAVEWQAVGARAPWHAPGASRAGQAPACLPPISVTS